MGSESERMKKELHPHHQSVTQVESNLKPLLFTFALQVAASVSTVGATVFAFCFSKRTCDESNDRTAIDTSTVFALVVPTDET